LKCKPDWIEIHRNQTLLQFSPPMWCSHGFQMRHFDLFKLSLNGKLHRFCTVRATNWNCGVTVTVTVTFRDRYISESHGCIGKCMCSSLGRHVHIGIRGLAGWCLRLHFEWFIDYYQREKITHKKDRIKLRWATFRTSNGLNVGLLHLRNVICIWCIDEVETLFTFSYCGLNGSLCLWWQVTMFLGEDVFGTGIWRELQVAVIFQKPISIKGNFMITNECYLYWKIFDWCQDRGSSTSLFTHLLHPSPHPTIPN
jgi:hypothetical protein